MNKIITEYSLTISYKFIALVKNLLSVFIGLVFFFLLHCKYHTINTIDCMFTLRMGYINRQVPVILKQK